MQIAQEAVSYYTEITGNRWDSFFELVDEAIAGDIESQEGDLWLVHALANTVIDAGISLEELKSKKDIIKSVFDNDGRKLAGEFFTPVIWAEELHRYMDRLIPGWRGSYNVWDASAGTGNLVRTAGVDPSHLYVSTLQDDDIVVLRGLDAIGGSEIFQFDFLSTVDDDWNNSFLDLLPDRLRQVILEDKPLIFLMNPPYKSGQAGNTGVGRYMTGNVGLYRNVDFTRPAYDLFYQFCFQMMNIVARFNLKNCYCCLFGPLTLFTGSSAGVLLAEFERTFEFMDGMCISAQEFGGTSESIVWGVGASIWKSRGGYHSEDGNFHKNILLDKKYLLPDGGIGCLGKIMYEQPKQKLSLWVAPTDTCEYVDYPVMTSHLTFKGGEVYENIAYKRAKERKDMWGTLMSQDTMTRSSDRSAVLSVPSSLQYMPIVKENFWRAVASFGFRRCYEADWSVAKKDISSPNTGVEGYTEWLRNALVIFLFEYKSMMSSLRGVVWESQRGLPDELREDCCIRNNFFFISPEEVREYCTDPVILKDMEEHSQTEGQRFMLQALEESKPYWLPEVKELFDWCKTYILATYDARKGVGYKGSLQSWDAGFIQVRSTLWDAIKLEPEYQRILTQAKECICKEVQRFGFVTEVQ